MGDSDFDTRRKALERQRRSLQIEWEEAGGNNPHLAGGDSVANIKRAEVLSTQIEAIDAQLQRLQEEEVDAARKAAGVNGTLADRVESLEKALAATIGIVRPMHDDVAGIRKNVLPPESLIEIVIGAMKKYVDREVAKLKAESAGGLVWLGPFENGKSYSPGQCVRHSGDAWVCRVETGTAPAADNVQWSLLVRGAR